MAASSGPDKNSNPEYERLWASMTRFQTRVETKMDTLIETVATLKERSRITHMMAGILGGALAIGGSATLYMLGRLLSDSE